MLIGCYGRIYLRLPNSPARYRYQRFSPQSCQSDDFFFLEFLFFLRPSTCIELRVQDVLNGKSSKLVVTHGEILYVHRSTFPYASPLS